MPRMIGSFVILHHTGPGPEHWDFMLEEGEGLATWQCPTNPADLPPGGTLRCRKLPDHRIAYLTYEGPVSGGRGQVRRVQEGSYHQLAVGENHRRVHLEGHTLLGLVELRQDQPDNGWSLRRLNDAKHTTNS